MANFNLTYKPYVCPDLIISVAKTEECQFEITVNKNIDLNNYKVFIGSKQLILDPSLITETENTIVYTYNVTDTLNFTITAQATCILRNTTIISNEVQYTHDKVQAEPCVPQNVQSQTIDIGTGSCLIDPSNWDTVYINDTNITTYIPQNGDIIYSDSNLTTPYIGNNDTYKMRYLDSNDELKIRNITFNVSNQGIVSNLVNCRNNPSPEILVVDKEESNNCYSDYIFTVNVPLGQEYSVQVLSDFAVNAIYNTPIDIADIIITQDVIHYITSNTNFAIRIDAAELTQEYTSYVYIIVRDQNNNPIDQIDFSRMHGAGNC